MPWANYAAEIRNQMWFTLLHMLALQCRRKEENRRLIVSVLLVWHHPEVKCLEQKAFHFDFYINTMFFALKHLLTYF